MTTVPSATATSTTSSTLWNNKGYFLLASLAGVALFVAYRYFNKQTTNGNRPIIPPADLSQCLIQTQFPYCANINPLFPSEAQGIIRISLEDLGLLKSRNPLEFIFIEYTHNGKTFSLPMTVHEHEAEVYLRHLPLGEKIHLQFKYQNTILSQQQALTVDQTFGIYQLYIEGGLWKVDSHPEAPHQAMGRFNFDFSADDALSLSINNSSKLETLPSRYTTQESYYLFENTTQKVHVLFFQIAGLTAYGDKAQRLVVPIAVFPGKLTVLPQGFLRTSWEQTFRATHGREPPPNPRLTIAGILDTAAPN